jgi:mRNA interferase MazF
VTGAALTALVFLPVVAAALGSLGSFVVLTIGVTAGGVTSPVNSAAASSSTATWSSTAVSSSSFANLSSNDFSNAISNRVQVVPLTTNVEKCYPCEAYISNNNKKSKAMADQIMTISKNRLKTKIGVITDRDMRAVEMAIKVQLSLQS